ncbi:MAG: VTT domain-containing protein [Roseiflexaceae bacterium]
MAESQPPASAGDAKQRQRWLRPLLVGLIMVAANVLAYYLIPPDVADRLGALGYLGIFLVTLIANATVIVPVPYYGIIWALAPKLNLMGVAAAGALGSALGESVAFFAGRSGRGAVEDTRFYRWVQQQLRHPVRAFVVLFLLSAPPNPAFDVAGLTAGAVGLPFWMFFGAVLLGRFVRMIIIALIGFGLE